MCIILKGKEYMMILLAAMIAFGAVAPIAPITSTAPVDEVTPLAVNHILYGIVRFDDSNGYVEITFTSDDQSIVISTIVYEAGYWEMHYPGGMLDGQLEAVWYRDSGGSLFADEYNIEFPDDWYRSGSWWYHEWNITRWYKRI